MIDLASLEVWFVTGSQHLYGPETLKKVEDHTAEMVRALSAAPQIPVKVVAKPVMTGAESIQQLCLEANAKKTCAGVIAWMHTFSPARMWIAGLRSLSKPLLHLHTQFNQDLPWSSIDMNRRFTISCTQFSASFISPSANPQIKKSERYCRR